MKKQELLNYFDDVLLEKLFGFCYSRTDDSYKAQELCSDIIFALIKSSNTNGDITDPYSFIWKVARNVYADFCRGRKRYTDNLFCGNPDDILLFIADEEAEPISDELIKSVYRRIAFLTELYRSVMIMFYLDGLSTSEIAKHLNISEGAVRQRLYSARKKLKSEVEEMTQISNKPVSLDKIDYVIWGTGNPGWGDPRKVCQRMLSKHVIWMCLKKPMSASEIAEELDVPTVYIEEELDILTKGENGSYGLLRQTDNGKYAINFILFDTDTIEKAHAVYSEHLPKICDIISDFIEKHKKEYLSFPYINRKPDLNLILWQQIFTMSNAFTKNVEKILEEKYFENIEKIDRPFSVFGYVNNGKEYGGGWDGINATNICGYAKVAMSNIYITRIRQHFNCGHNISNDPQIQLAIRAVHGLDVSALSESEKEHAAKAIESGYIYRDGDSLYTKILVNSINDDSKLFDISNRLSKEFFEEAQCAANNLSALIKKAVPDYLLGEWKYANLLASLPVLDSVVENLIEKGILTPPEDGIGAEGCWMSISE